MVRFIILSTQRSGSTFLVTSLSSHPQIECYGEIFLPKDTRNFTYNTYRTASTQRKLSHLFQRKKLIYRYLANLYANTPNVEAVGFKLMYSQIKQYPKLTAWNKVHNVKIIHLIRANSLKIIVSRKTAHIRGIYHSTKSLDTFKVYIDTKKLKIKLQRINQLTEKYRNIFSRNPYLEVTYESFVTKKDEQTQKITKFLEIDTTVQLKSHLIKINPDSLENTIENYQEVAQTLKGTVFEHYLDD